MKITKFEQSCLLVEMPEPVNRTVLFDPGVMSEASLDVNTLDYLDDIIITHGHGDHFSLDLIKQLVAKFPSVCITAPPEVVIELEKNSILELKPKYILPIHDWHWREEARTQMYGAMEQVFEKNGIKFISLNTGEPVVLEV